MTTKEAKLPAAAGFIILSKKGKTVRVLGLESYDGLYDLPKGKLEDGEETLAGALRECYEEAGISYIRILSNEGKEFPGRLVLFIGTTSDEPKVRTNPKTGIQEHKGYTWLRLDENTSKDFAQYLRQPIEWAIGLLNSEKLEGKIL